MSSPTGLDIRIPVGGLFTILGALLAVYGGLGGPGHPATGTAADFAALNVDLWWGLVMVGFGVLLLLLARRGARAAGVHPALQTPGGEAIEQREERTGLEED